MNESYWTYKASSPTPDGPPLNVSMSDSQWHSFSPGMRRAIWQDYNRRQKGDPND